jgi:hypothetical protein
MTCDLLDGLVCDAEGLCRPGDASSLVEPATCG